MYTHSANTFLYKQYQDEVRWLVERVDQRDYEPLATRARSTIRQLERDWPLGNLGYVGLENGVWKEVSTQEWPLLYHSAGGLATSDDIKTHPSPGPRDVGYWFLIVLAAYLGPCPSAGGNWSVLRDALVLLGWNQGDAELLFQGLPPYKLLKPNIVEKTPWPLTHSSPYWLWLHADRGKSGWLPVEEVYRFHDRLRKAKDRITAFDLRKLPDIDIENPIVIRDYKEYLRCSYRDTIAMLLAAKEQDQGLFMSTLLSSFV